ncbi:pyruvate oxidase [Pediococcus argentinicus]|uniref:pyruvate oxidase n=1 Tax=Pediococcus argentinicus TaxID=480391 RepID=UPI00338F3EC8
MTKMKAGQALIKTLENWDVDHIYGVPGGSINATVDGLYQERDSVRYIQVRHEEVGAMAASADAKFTGKIGVAFGSAGPGATHLMNGLYDAKMDHVPVLALVGQVPTANMNTNFFQEMDETPIFADVAVYNRTVTNANQIPAVINEAVRTAYSQRGVSVVVLPNDLTDTEIDYNPAPTSDDVKPNFTENIDSKAVQDTIKLIKEAKRPLIFAGLGLRGAAKEVEQLSEQFNIPILATAPSTGFSVDSNHKNFLGSFGRLGTKPAAEAVNAADLILFMGTNFPFARFWPQTAKIVQVNNRVEDIGKQTYADLTVVADAKAFVQALIDSKETAPETKWLTANRTNKANWDKWLDAIAADESKGLAPEAVVKAIADHSASDALYGIDVGNNTEHATRLLPLNGGRHFAMSAWFATMGYGLPSGMGAKLSYPDKQVWSISGDGGFSMVAPDIITEARYNLPVINIVLSNQALGFIQHEQVGTKQRLYGVDLTDADWARAGEAFGAIGFTVTNHEELNTVMEKIDQLQKEGNQKPIVIDAKTNNVDPIDTSMVTLDPDVFDAETIENYKKAYNVFDQPALSELLK